MKTICLLNEDNVSLKQYTYNKLTELDGEFKKRNIVIGYGVKIGDGVKVDMDIYK